MRGTLASPQKIDGEPGLQVPARDVLAAPHKPRDAAPRRVLEWNRSVQPATARRLSRGENGRGGARGTGRRGRHEKERTERRKTRSAHTHEIHEVEVDADVNAEDEVDEAVDAEEDVAALCRVIQAAVSPRERGGRPGARRRETKIQRRGRRQSKARRGP